MDWRDEGIVLSVRPMGETGALLSLMTRHHGRHAGMVPGGAGRRARSALQSGNRLLVTWKARLSEQLGRFAWEAGDALGTRWLADGARLDAVAAACALIEGALPEREAHEEVYLSLLAFLCGLDAAAWAPGYVRWELALLSLLGFGLDLSSCAATGSRTGLVYVSPRSGQAVSAEAGAPYHDRLLALPAFLIGENEAGTQEVVAGLALTGYFLDRHVFGPQGKALPGARSRLAGRVGA